MLLFVGHAAKLYQVAFITQLDNIIYDWRLRRTMPSGQDERIVILDIDEKSLGEIGRWPWGRGVMADIVNKLFDQHRIAVLGFDIVWAERDTSSGIDTLDSLAQNDLKDLPAFQQAYRGLRSKLDNDGQFAQAIKGRPVVLGYYFNLGQDAVRVNAIPEPVLPKGTFAGRNILFTHGVGYTGNLPAFLENAATAGHFNPVVDFDGVSRRVPVLLEYEGAYYEPLSLAIVRTLIALKDKERRYPKVESGYAPERFLRKGYPGLEWLKVGPLTIPVDETASAFVPYRGGRSSFPYISLADVVKDRVKPGVLEGKVALIGATAPGLFDQRATPVDEIYPGVEIHANLIAGMIDGNIKQMPPYMLGAEVLLLVICGVALSVLLPILSAFWATLAAALAFALVVALDFGLWSLADTILPLAASILMTALLYTMNMAYGYFVADRAKRQLGELFGQYVPPELVETMAKDPERYTMEPRDAELTILFSDVRGFTSISEALSPEDLREYINEYLTEMSIIIRNKCRGTLDKYIGDAIMAFWSAPVDDPNHARDGVLAALEMQRASVALDRKFTGRGWPQLRIGVGVNSGKVRVGDMGSKIRRAYTAMGDPVNAASRLEGRTKFYGVGCLVGEATRNLVKGVVFREIDKVKVKGKEEVLTIYEPIGLDTEVDEKTLDELKLWHQALRLYRARNWDQVEVSLLNLLRMNPGYGLYGLYSERVTQHRRVAPPQAWEGVTVFDEK
ncbi:MAG: adenylate/guanylate cyclase domain-containing protein [Burkholderiales bacterium]